MLTLACNLPTVCVEAIVLVNKLYLEDRWYGLTKQLEYQDLWFYQPLQFCSSVIMLFLLISDPYTRTVIRYSLTDPIDDSKVKNVKRRAS